MNLLLLGTRRIDLLKRTVTDDHGSERLTPHEAELLAYLADADGRAVPRQELLENVWGYHASVRSRTVDTTLSRLRGKLETDPSRPRFLRTIRGAGIQLSDCERPEPLVPPAAPATLVGRDDLVRTIHLPNPGLVTLVGPPGVGKTALARVLAPDSWWIDGQDVTDSRRLEAEVSRALGARRVAQTLATGEKVLVLDGLEGLDDAAVIADWARQAAILVTSHAPLGLPGEQVVQVEPLGADASRELLQSRIHALGLQVDEAVLERALRTLDGLPLELEVLAPTLGLFGDHALDELDAHLTATEIQDTALRAIQLLSDGDRELLVQLAEIEGPFDAPTAVVVTGRPAPVLVPSMLRLTRRSLLETRSGRLALLATVRRAARAAEGEQLARARAHAAQRMTQWLVTHRDQALVDAARTLLPRRRDLEKALRRATDRPTLEALAVPWVDLADLVGPDEDFLPALQEAAARFPDSDVLWLTALRLQAASAHAPPTDVAKLDVQRHGVEALRILALTAQTSGDQARRAELHQALSDHLCHADLRTRARLQPLLVDPETLSETLAPLRQEAQRRGWHAVDANIRRAELKALATTGHFAQIVARRDEWPADDDVMGSETAFWLGYAHLMLGEPEAARDAFVLQGARQPCDQAYSIVYGAIADLVAGKLDVIPRLRAALTPAVAPGTRRLGQAVLCWLGAPGVALPDDLDLARLLEEGPTDRPPRRTLARMLWLVMQRHERNSSRP